MIYNTEQKVNETSTINNCKDEVLFNSDTLTKVISYLPSVDVLNLALTCTKFSTSKCILSTTVTLEQSLIEKSTYIVVQDLATEEQLAALPHYDGDSSLADYHYLQLLREPLTFDQLVGGAEYVNSDDKTCVINSSEWDWDTAFSNNIMRAGKHYATFQAQNLGDPSVLTGVMRPGQSNENTRGNPLRPEFYKNFSQVGMSYGGDEDKNNIFCCLYNTNNGYCHTRQVGSSNTNTEGMESLSSDGEIGMLLDLDEGTLSVYKNGQNLGVMKSGLAGPYCWLASMYRGSRVTIERGTIPS